MPIKKKRKKGKHIHVGKKNSKKTNSKKKKTKEEATCIYGIVSLLLLGHRDYNVDAASNDSLNCINWLVNRVCELLSN